MTMENAATVRRSIVLTPVRAGRLRRLAQRYHVREEQVITRALDMLFNLTEELDPETGRFHAAMLETSVPCDEVSVSPIADARAARFEQALSAYQATGDPTLVNVLVDSVLGCLGRAKPDEYDPIRC
ncbi:MAG TPA: hypothetical protein PKZ84_01355 [Anaerolineae bacterium]|nr:hypothetical protein [Anaerolineae bacterium]HQI83045.1 hypothetical protein [Anaerolineae bacterium]